MSVSLERKAPKKDSNNSKKGSSKTMSNSSNKSKEVYEKIQQEVSKAASDASMYMANIEFKALDNQIKGRKKEVIGSNKRDMKEDMKLVYQIMKESVDNKVSEKSLLEGKYKYDKISKQGITKNRYYMIKKAWSNLKSKTTGVVSNIASNTSNKESE